MTNHPVLRYAFFPTINKLVTRDRVTIWLLTGFMGCHRFLSVAHMKKKGISKSRSTVRIDAE